MTATQPVITLDSISHIYWCNGKQMESVGSLVKRVTPPFDADYWAQRKADERGVAKSVVLGEWAAKRDSSCDKGHAVHAAIQKTLSAHVLKEPFDTVNQCALPEARHWLAWWNGAKAALTVKALEHIVGSEELGYAGTLDCLAASTLTGNDTIIDWKTNGEYRTENRYGETLLAPFDDLPNCEHSKYSLQLALYAVALERTGHAAKIGSCWVLHLSPEWAAPHRALDLRRRAEQWVKGLNLTSCAGSRLTSLVTGERRGWKSQGQQPLPGPPPPAANPQAAAGNRSPAGAAALAQPTTSERSIEK